MAVKKTASKSTLKRKVVAKKPLVAKKTAKKRIIAKPVKNKKLSAKKLSYKKTPIKRTASKKKVKLSKPFGIAVMLGGLAALILLVAYGLPTILNSDSGKKPVLGVTVNGVPANPAFTDANFYACVLDNLNNSKIDGINNRTYAHYATARELAAMKTLNCNKYGSADNLKLLNTNGIELLTGLQTLALVGSENIESINISNSPLLTEVTLRSRKLTSLDVSKQTQLRKLAIAGSPVSAIDIRKNTELTFLEIRSDTMSSIDISNNRKLEYAQIICKNIKDINLTNNIALKTLYIGDANGGSGVKTIDISKNTSLETLIAVGDFATVDISNNKSLNTLMLDSPNLTNMVLGNNVSLQTIKIGTYLNSSASVNITNLDVTRFPELTTLVCERCQLTSIDVSKNTKLKTLNVSRSMLTAVNLNKNTALQYLSLTDNQLTSIDTTKNIALKTLYIQGNRINNIDITKNYELDSADLGSNLVSIDLTNNTKLTYLAIGGTQLKSINLANNTALNILEIGGTTLTDIDLSKNNNLSQVSLYNNNKLTSLNILNTSKLNSFALNTYPVIIKAISSTKHQISADQKVISTYDTDIAQFLASVTPANKFVTIGVYRNGSLVSSDKLAVGDKLRVNVTNTSNNSVRYFEYQIEFLPTVISYGNLTNSIDVANNILYRKPLSFVKSVDTSQITVKGSVTITEAFMAYKDGSRIMGRYAFLVNGNKLVIKLSDGTKKEFVVKTAWSW